MKLVLDRDADRLGEARGLLQPRPTSRRAPRAELGQSDDRARAARIFAGFLAIEALSRSLLGLVLGEVDRIAGWIVETACL